MAGILRVCFIDDSPFERDLFRQVYSPLPGWETYVAETYAQAREMLGPRVPLLWLLDLWGNDPRGAGRTRLLPAGELAGMAAQIPAPGTVWEGLEDFPGDRANEYLKRLYSLVSGWTGLFLEAARAADQTKAYGLYNLARVREDYPGCAAVAYTRKSQPGDLTAFLAAGGDGVLLKPHSTRGEAAILAETKARAPELVALMTRTLTRTAAHFLLTTALSLDGPRAGHLNSLARAVLGPGGAPEGPEPPLEPGLAGYCRAVREWLGTEPV